LVWAELERRGATIAVVPFHGRAGAGGESGTITLSRLQDGELVDVERWTGRDELADALEAPLWGRYGSFAGQPPIDGAVIWTTQDRRVVISGTRARRRFQRGGAMTQQRAASWRRAATPKSPPDALPRSTASLVCLSVALAGPTDLAGCATWHTPEPGVAAAARGPPLAYPGMRKTGPAARSSGDIGAFQRRRRNEVAAV
jgi:hypothetical protein